MKLSIIFFLCIVLLFSSNLSIHKKHQPIQETKIVVIEKEKITKFVNPIHTNFKISSEQGIRLFEDNGISLTNYHNGIDIPCPDKTKVYASKSGKVITVYPSYYNGEKWQGHPTYGGLVEILHNDGTRTLYAHLSFTEVNEGQIVIQGQEIGWSGGVKDRRGSGISTGPHLHFCIYLDINTFLDKFF